MFNKSLLPLLGVLFFYSCSCQQFQTSYYSSYGFVRMQNKSLEKSIDSYAKKNSLNLKKCIITINETNNDSIVIISNVKNDPFTYNKKPYLYSLYKNGVVVFIKNVNVFDTIQIRKSFSRQLEESGIELRRNTMFYDPEVLYVNVLK